jgi:HSP20 family molecular chaperone IbpA
MSLIAWDDTPMATWYPRRRRQTPWSQMNQLGSLWDEAMNEVACLQNDLDRQVRQFGVEPDFWPRTGAIEHHVEGQEGAPGKYCMSIPLGPNITPNDLKISLKNNVMCVEAKKEQTSPDGTSRVYQEYHRKFTLPEGVKMDEVKSTLHPDGYLKIEAPLPQLAITEQTPKEIPIEMARPS